jgi:hypothetical protein
MKHSTRSLTGGIFERLRFVFVKMRLLSGKDFKQVELVSQGLNLEQPSVKLQYIEAGERRTVKESLKCSPFFF